jgi:hypothetical protein
MNELLREVLVYKGQGENPGLSYLVSLHDQKIDTHFGINFDQIEKEIKGLDEEYYPELEAPALLTSYLDYHQIFEDLGPGKSLIDLGAGYCRGTLLSCSNASYAVECFSYEILKSRMIPAYNYLEGSHYLVAADLNDSNLKLPSVDAFYLYLPTGRLLNNIFKKMLYQFKNHPVLYVCESHGDLIETLNFYHSYFEKIPSSLKTSLTRHDPVIHKYRLTKSQEQRVKDFDDLILDDIKDVEKIALWILKFGETDIEATISSEVANLGDKRTWQAKLKNLSLILYHGQMALFLPASGRILQLHGPDQIIQVNGSDSLSH